MIPTPRGPTLAQRSERDHRVAGGTRVFCGTRSSSGRAQRSRVGDCAGVYVGRALGSVPVRLTVDVGGRLPEQIEVAADDVVIESIANIDKHARARAASVEIDRTNQWFGCSLEIVDDGVGGADSERGSGLRGLADRVEALGGRLRVWTPQGWRDPSEGGDPVRVAIAEDSVLLRGGLAELSREADFEVVGQCNECRRPAPEGAKLLARHRDR